MSRAFAPAEPSALGHDHEGSADPSSTAGGRIADGTVAVVLANFLTERVGHELSRPRDGFASVVEGCLPAILDTVRENTPVARPVLVGRSAGGQLGLIAAARFVPDIPIALAASGSRVAPGVRRLTTVALPRRLASVAAVLGRWPGDRPRFDGRHPEAVIRDWSRLVRTGRYAAATGSFDYEAALTEYRGDIFAVDVSGDTLAPQTVTDALLAMFPEPVSLGCIRRRARLSETRCAFHLGSRPW